MRIDHLEQRLREARELGFELELHARGQEREAFEQPLDIRVGDFEPCRCPGGRRSSGTRCANSRPSRADGAAPVRSRRSSRGSISRVPRVSVTTASRAFPARSRSSRNNRSGTGCAHSSPSISNTSAGVGASSRGLRARTRSVSGLDARLERADRLGDGGLRTRDLAGGTHQPGEARNAEIDRRASRRAGLPRDPRRSRDWWCSAATRGRAARPGAVAAWSDVCWSNDSRRWSGGMVGQPVEQRRLQAFAAGRLGHDVRR